MATMVTLTGTFQDGAGTPESGSVLFSLAEAATDGLVAYTESVVRCTLDPLGAFTVDLEATDDLTTTGNTYRVVERFNGRAPRIYWIELPGDTDPANIVDLTAWSRPPFVVVDPTLAASNAGLNAYIATADKAYRRGFNVKEFGATGDGTTDDTAAIQAAIDAVLVADAPEGGQMGGTVYLPAGRYVVSDTLTIGWTSTYVSAFRLCGESEHSAVLEPTTGFAAKPVVKFVNARRSGVYDLGVHGNATTPPRAGIVFHRDTPGPGAPAITRCEVSRVAIGRILQGDTPTMIVDGIRVTSAQDGNNDFHSFSDFHISGFTGIGVSYEAKESVSNTIRGGMIQFGPIAVSQQGGSVDVEGLAVQEITDCEFDFLAPFTSHYTTATRILNVQSEVDLGNGAQMVRTTTDPYINIQISGYSRYGSQASLNVIDYNSPGSFTLSDSMLQLGQSGQVARFTDPDSVVQLSGVAHGFTRIEWEGLLTIVGGEEYTTVTMDPGASALLNRLGGNGAWTAYTPTLGGTGWAIGDGTASGRYWRLGNTVHYTAVIVFGSTSTYGAGASPTISLPVTQLAGRQSQCDVFATDSGTGFYALYGRTDTAAATLFVPGTNGALGFGVRATTPFTWTAGDIIEVTGTYEAA